MMAPIEESLVHEVIDRRHGGQGGGLATTRIVEARIHRGVHALSCRAS